MLKEISSAFWCISLWSKHSGNKSGSHAPFTRVVGVVRCVVLIQKWCIIAHNLILCLCILHLWLSIKDCMVCRGDDVPGPGIFSDYTTGDWHSVPAYWPETPNRVKLRNSRSILLAYICFIMPFSSFLPWLFTLYITFQLNILCSYSL